MASNQNSRNLAQETIDNQDRAAARAARQEAAKTEDSARIRAGAAAGRDSRSIGVIRRAYGRGR